jgi:hypothetical protein
VGALGRSSLTESTLALAVGDAATGAQLLTQPKEAALSRTNPDAAPGQVSESEPTARPSELTEFAGHDLFWSQLNGRGQTTERECVAPLWSCRWRLLLYLKDTASSGFVCQLKRLGPTARRSWALPAPDRSRVFRGKPDDTPMMTR